MHVIICGCGRGWKNTVFASDIGVMATLMAVVIAIMLSLAGDTNAWLFMMMRPPWGWSWQFWGHLDIVNEDSTLLLRDLLSNVYNDPPISSIPPQAHPPTLNIVKQQAAGQEEEQQEHIFTLGKFSLAFAFDHFDKSIQFWILSVSHFWFSKWKWIHQTASTSSIQVTACGCRLIWNLKQNLKINNKKTKKIWFKMVKNAPSKSQRAPKASSAREYFLDQISRKLNW